MEMNDMAAHGSVNNNAVNTSNSKALTNDITVEDLSMENKRLLPSQSVTDNEVKIILLLVLYYLYVFTF